MISIDGAFVNTEAGASLSVNLLLIDFYCGGRGLTCTGLSPPIADCCALMWLSCSMTLTKSDCLIPSVSLLQFSGIPAKPIAADSADSALATIFP